MEGLPTRRLDPLTINKSLVFYQLGYMFFIFIERLWLFKTTSRVIEDIMNNPNIVVSFSFK